MFDRLLDKLLDWVFVLTAGGILSLYEKIKAAFTRGGVAPKEGGPEPQPAAHSEPSKPLTIRQGVAASFIADDFYRLPHSEAYDKIRDKAIFYPQTREGATTFLNEMAEKLKGSWVATTVLGVTGTNEDGTSRQEALKLISELEEVHLDSDFEDDDLEEDDSVEVDPEERDSKNTDPKDAQRSDKDVMWVTFIGDNVGFLESGLAAEIAETKEDDTQRMLAFVLEVTSGSERGIEIGILRWEAKADGDVTWDED